MQCCNGIIGFCIIVRCVLCISMHQSSTPIRSWKRLTAGNDRKSGWARLNNTKDLVLWWIYASHFIFLMPIFRVGCNFFSLFLYLNWKMRPKNDDEKKKLKTKLNKPYLKKKKPCDSYGIRPSIATTCMHEWRMHMHANLSIRIIKNKVRPFVIILPQCCNSIQSVDFQAHRFYASPKLNAEQQCQIRCGVSRNFFFSSQNYLIIVFSIEN